MKGTEWVIRDGYRSKTIRVGNTTIEIHRPILTDEERNKREDLIKDALMGFGKGKEHESF